MGRLLLTSPSTSGNFAGGFAPTATQAAWFAIGREAGFMKSDEYPYKETL